jgi:diguanylate cyclase (GGDEF)-like protein
MLLAPEPRDVRSWPMLQRRSADLRQRGCTPSGSRRCLLGTVTAGIWMDSQELQRLARGTLDADLTLVVGDVPVASTIGRLTAEDRVPAGDGTRRGTLAGRQVVMSTEPLTSKVGEQARLLVSIPATPTTAGIDSRLLAIVLLGLVVVCLIATLLGSVLARLVSRPLGELAEQARAIARGDFGRPPTGVRSGGEVGDLDLPPSILRSRGELGELARAFERMRVELGEYLTALRSGAWNYRYFERRFEQEIERSRRFGRVLALLMLDIDHFKSVNDRFGHQRGDEVLVEFARRVTGSVRDIDTFARYGGEEFVLILPETNLEGGLAVAEKLRLATHRTPFCGKGARGRGPADGVDRGGLLPRARNPARGVAASRRRGTLRGQAAGAGPGGHRRAAPAAADQATWSGQGKGGQGRVESTV